MKKDKNRDIPSGDSMSPFDATQQIEEKIKDNEITFDVFFGMLLKAREVFPHHREPLRVFLENKLGKLATIEDWKKQFELY